MATKVNYRNIPRFLLLLLGALMLSLIMQERLNLSRPMAVPCALWVVNQLNTHLDYFYALLAIVMIGFMHVQLSDDAGKGFALFEALDIFAEESGAEEGDDAAIEEEETDDGFGPPAEVVGDSEL